MPEGKEGNIPLGLQPPYLNIPPSASDPDPAVRLGRVEFTGQIGLEPALTLEGVDLIENINLPGSPPPAIVPFERSLLGTLDSSLDEVSLIGEFNPIDDADQDGEQDLSDNCSFTKNNLQADNGGFDTATPDSQGDLCQCGESSGNGIVETGTPATVDDDYIVIRDYLAGRYANDPALETEIESRCSVIGTTECNIRDLFFLREALDLAIAPKSFCDAALSPAN